MKISFDRKVFWVVKIGGFWRAKKYTNRKVYRHGEGDGDDEHGGGDTMKERQSNGDVYIYTLYRSLIDILKLFRYAYIRF